MALALGSTPAFGQNQPGYSPVPDYTGDGRADVGDAHTASGQFWIRANLGTGSCQAPPAFTAYGTPQPSPGWKTLSADFTGDGRADFMDVHIASGQFWVHENLGATFSAANWTLGGGIQTGADWEVLAGNFVGSAHAELLEHNRVTGQIRVWHNSGGVIFALGYASAWSSTPGADWRIALGDFNGDGYADVADYHVPSSQFWIHLNLANGHFNAGAWAMATAFNHPVFTTVFGDYTGDGLADYADVNKATGEFWVHQALGFGFFAPVNWAYCLYTPSAGFSILGLPVTFP